MKSLVKNKTGGVVSSTVMGVGGLIIGVIIILLIVSTIYDADLIAGNEKGAAGNLSANFTAGINNVAEKVPTILLVVAVVFLIGALVLLMKGAKAMGIGGGGSL